MKFACSVYNRQDEITFPKTDRATARKECADLLRNAKRNGCRLDGGCHRFTIYYGDRIVSVVTIESYRNG